MFRRTRWLQLSQLSRNFFARRPNIFRSLLKTIRTHKNVLKKKHFSSKVSCGNVHFSFGNAAGSLLTKNGTSSLKKRKLREINIFFKKNSSKWPSGHVEYCFYNRKVFAHCPKMTKKFLFPKNFHQNKPMETWNAVLSNLLRKSCRRAEIFSGQSPKKNWKLEKKIENIFRRSVPMDAENTNLTNPSKNIWQNAKFFCSVSKKNKKSVWFPAKNFFQIVPVDT